MRLQNLPLHSDRLWKRRIDPSFPALCGIPASSFSGGSRFVRTGISVDKPYNRRACFVLVTSTMRTGVMFEDAWYYAAGKII